MQWFADFAEGVKAPRNADQSSVMVAEDHCTILNYLTRDLDMPKQDVASLAVEFGLQVVQYDYGCPLTDDELGNALQGAILLDSQPGVGQTFPEMSTAHDLECAKKQNFRLDYPKTRKLQNLVEFLGDPYQSVVVRHLLAVAFVRYSRSAHRGVLLGDSVGRLQAYENVLEEEIAARMQICEEELDVELTEPERGRWD